MLFLMSSGAKIKFSKTVTCMFKIVKKLLLNLVWLEGWRMVVNNREKGHVTS